MTKSQPDSFQITEVEALKMENLRLKMDQCNAMGAQLEAQMGQLGREIADRVGVKSLEGYRLNLEKRSVEKVEEPSRIVRPTAVVG